MEGRERVWALWRERFAWLLPHYLVYGFVAGIVKLDDAGLWLVARGGGASKALGRAILAFAPWLMKALSIVGTAAMFLVGGGILVHGIPGMEGFIHHLTDPAGKTGGLLLSMLADGLVGMVAGAIVLAVVAGYQKVRRGATTR